LELRFAALTIDWNDGMLEKWNDGMAPFGQINAFGGKEKN
jgi:head-tail adaptor